MSRVLTVICVIAGLTGVGLMLVGGIGIRSGHLTLDAAVAFGSSSVRPSWLSTSS
jgi:hypothetical protein